MTTKTWKYGKYNCKAYKKACGKGWEVGFSFAGKTIFVGNFIHQKEATAWWTKMNACAHTFTKRYTLPKGANTTFFTKFMGNYMYKAYYAWLDTQFTKYNRGYAHAFRKDERRWTTMRKSHGHKWERHTMRKSA